VPIGIVTLALSMRLLPHTEPSGHRFDLWSAVLCALMFGSLMSGINSLGHGQAAPAVAGEFIGAVATGYLLVRRQAAQAMPLLPIDLFRRPIFSVSVTTSVLCFIAQGLAFVSLPFYLQDVIGVSAVATGLLMTPWPATSALMAPFAGRLADRYPASILGSIGLAIVGVGFVLLAVLPSHPGTGDILWRIAVCGGGMGLFQQPGAGAIQGSARLLGQSIGAAMVALVFGVSVGGHGAVTALVLAACFAAVATVVSLTRQFDFVRARRPEREPGATEPADAPGSAAFVGSRRGRHPLGGS
jgi:DHA2 family multidrug resistance protein-like MFS transporter